MESRNYYPVLEHYQALYKKNHRSKIFASLTEAYLKRGLLKPALEICQRGVKIHPHFPNGHMALAKVYLSLNKVDKAIIEFKKVVELSPENILAHKLLAETFLQQNQYKLALRSFKMVLFLSPKNAEVIEQVRKLEKLISKKYDRENNDTFEMKPLEKLRSPGQTQQITSDKGSKPARAYRPPAFLERTLSLADAYIKRNDIQWALKTLEDAENSLGPHPEFTKRIRFLSARPYSDLPDMIENTPSAPQDILKKVDFLKKLLARIDKNSTRTSSYLS